MRGGLDMIAICDHNASGNVAAVQEAAGEVLAVLAGMEITTQEEAHVVALFPDAASARAASDEVQATIPTAKKKISIYGRQLFMDALGETLGEEDRMLFMASALPLSEAVQVIKRYGGLAIASHVDRPSNSVISQLGFFPTDVTFDAIEVSCIGVQEGRAAGFAHLGLPIVTSSDGHFLTDIGSGYTVMTMNDTTFDEVALTLQGIEGRGCQLA